jgi:hypothetical protein
MERFGEDGSLDDNVESFLSHEEDPRESLFGGSKRSPAGHSMDVSKGELALYKSSFEPEGAAGASIVV